VTSMHTRHRRFLSSNRSTGSQIPYAQSQGVTARTGTVSKYRQQRKPIGLWLAIVVWIALPAAWVLLLSWVITELAR
jgi:hypothetical protein